MNLRVTQRRNEYIKRQKGNPRKGGKEVAVQVVMRWRRDIKIVGEMIIAKGGKIGMIIDGGTEIEIREGDEIMMITLGRKVGIETETEETEVDQETETEVDQETEIEDDIVIDDEKVKWFSDYLQSSVQAHLLFIIQIFHHYMEKNINDPSKAQYYPFYT